MAIGPDGRPPHLAWMVACRNPAAEALVGRVCRLRLAAVVKEVAVCPDRMVEKEGPYLLLAACHLLHLAAAVAYPYRMLVGLAYLLLHPPCLLQSLAAAASVVAAEASFHKGYSADGLAVTLSSASYL